MEGGAVVTCLLRGAANERLSRLDVDISNIDITDEPSIDPLLSEADVVFHCAYDGRNEDWNFRAIRSLISCCARGGARLVHVSSFVVYDLPHAGELTELSADTARGKGYGRVKLELEKNLMAAAEFGGLWATIVQPTIVYGPFSKAWTIEPVEMLRYGTVVLPDADIGICNAVHVDDVVDGMIAASQSDAALGQRFLISGEPLTWAEFYETLAVTAGTERPKYLKEKEISASFGIWPSILRAIVSPMAFARTLSRRRKIRKMLDVILATMPRSLAEPIYKKLFAPISRQVGYVHLPDLGFIKNKSTITSRKAREMIGYFPRVDFSEGVIAMKDYLREI